MYKDSGVLSAVPWDQNVVLRYLTAERMQPYLTECDDSLDAAFDLYEWNIKAAAALQGTTAMVEVVVRNSVDMVLSDWVDQRAPEMDWFGLPIWDAHGQATLAKAKQRAARSSHGAPSHGKILAELSFGFWRYLVSKRYLTTLWIPALNKAFPHGAADIRTRQQEVSSALVTMNFVRNRAAHLEPVFKRDLQKDLSDAQRLLSWVNADAESWLNDTNALAGAIATRPAKR